MTVIGPINFGNLTDYLFFFENGQSGANWQGATNGFVGDVAIDGNQASETTAGTVPYAETIYTNSATLGAWQNIVDQNDPPEVDPAQAFASYNEVALIAGLEADLISAFQQINALAASPGYTSVSSTSLDGLNTQDGTDEVFVINITSGLNFSSKINITGDAGDVFILRWDTDGNPANGYQGQVKPSSGGAIVPHGGLTPANFINVAGDINASGGGTTPLPPYPQGPRFDDGQGDLIVGGSDFSGGGYFTGYWLTTGSPTIFDPVSGLYYGETSSLSNGIFVGGWYTITTRFSMTSGTSGVYVSPNIVTSELSGKVVNKEHGCAIAGATVKLFDSNGNLIATTTTTTSGEYLFSELEAGTYYVIVEKTCYLPNCQCNYIEVIGGMNYLNISLAPDCICEIMCLIAESENAIIVEKLRIYRIFAEYFKAISPTPPPDKSALNNYVRWLDKINDSTAELDCCVSKVLESLTCEEVCE